MSIDRYWYIVAIINFLGITQGLFIALILVTLKSTNRLANFLLAALLVSFSIGIAGASLGASGYYLQFPHLIRVGDPFVLLIGPLFFLYARTLARVPFARKDLWHFIPFLLYMLYLIPFYSQPASQKVAFVQQMQASKSVSILFIVLLRSVFLLTYTYFTYRHLKQYNSSLKEQFSNIDKLNLRWLNQVAYLLFVVIICSFLMYALILSGQLSFLISNYLTSLLLTIVIYTISLLGVRHARLFISADNHPPQEQSALPAPADAPAKPVSRYEHSLLSQEKSAKFLQRLITGMRQEKLYLQPDLSLQMLADQLKIPPHYLSQVINEQLGQNFFDFINHYRVEEVKSRLVDPAYSHLTILAIAFDSGFNSKSAFNLAFKNHTGLTPSQYRAQFKY